MESDTLFPKLTTTNQKKIFCAQYVKAENTLNFREKQNTTLTDVIF